MSNRVLLAGLLALFLACGSAHATVLWGVTNGTNDGGFWTGGEIFTVDTATGPAVVEATYGTDQLLAFGDIAVRRNGEVYVTYYGVDGFDKLAKVNTTTWAFDWVQDLGGWNDQVNALNFVDDVLYGVTGGGIPADLIQFTLTGSGATATNLGNLGINSDGDLAVHPGTGQWYYTSWETGSTSELNTISFGPLSKTGQEILTSSGWAGLAFGPGGLYAGTYWDQNLYTLDYDTPNPTHTATLVRDLSGQLGGNITGLSDAIPEPSSLLLIGGGLVALYAIRRQRRRRS